VDRPGGLAYLFRNGACLHPFRRANALELTCERRKKPVTRDEEQRSRTDTSAQRRER
jgi:hypothetical protein